MKKTTAMTTFEPENLDQAMKLCEILARSNLLPSVYRGKPGDVLVTLITGRELGLSSMQAIRGMHVIEGKAIMGSDLMVGLCKTSSECHSFRLVSSSDTAATYETRRRGDPEPTRMTYTLDQAKKANLLGKNNWRTHPAAMLRARCSAALARATYPDVVLGVYTPDEGEEFSTTAPRPMSDIPSEPSIDVDCVEVATPSYEELSHRIGEANTEAELSALADDIRQLSDDERELLRDAYRTRSQELRNKGNEAVKSRVKRRTKNKAKKMPEPEPEPTPKIIAEPEVAIAPAEPPQEGVSCEVCNRVSVDGPGEVCADCSPMTPHDEGPRQREAF